MNEEFDMVKTEYNGIGEMKDIWENPVVKLVISHIPIISSGLNSGVAKALEMHQKMKLEKLFEIILEDNDITIDDIEDVECIMEIAKTMDVVNRLIRNDKIKYLGKLLKNSIKDGDNRNVDEFEELLNKLSELSLREINMLHLLYDEEERITKVDNNKQEIFNPEESWESFIHKAKSEYKLNETEIISLMLGIMRTGFCVGEWKAYLNASATLVMYTSPEYRKLLKKIK